MAAALIQFGAAYPGGFLPLRGIARLAMKYALVLFLLQFSGLTLPAFGRLSGSRIWGIC